MLEARVIKELELKEHPVWVWGITKREESGVTVFCRRFLGVQDFSTIFAGQRIEYQS